MFDSIRPEFMAMFLIITLVTSCSMLADFAMDQVTGGSKGGINTELVVGDKEQVLGSNQDVKAHSVGKVVGGSDSSVVATTVDTLEVSNTNYPGWLIVVLLIGNVVFLCLPTPTRIFNYIKNRNNK
jgi:hypothetical protein